MFNTLEVCTKTWHVAKYLDFEMKDDRVINIYLPNGVSLIEHGDESQRASRTEFVWLSNGHSPVSYDADSSELTDTALLNLLVVYLSGSTSPAAVEVLFGPVKVKLIGGQLINSTFILSPDDGKEKFPIGGEGWSPMKMALTAVLKGTYNGKGSEDVLAAPATRFAYLLESALLDRRVGLLDEVENPVMSVLANVSRNIAASLSRGIAIHNENKAVEGENLGPVTFVKVRWPWLLLLGLRILLSVIFVTIVIIRTALSNLGVTKSSLLPVLFAINSEEQALVQDSTEDKYHEEFKKIAHGATGGVGKLSIGVKRRGWVLREPSDEI